MCVVRKVFRWESLRDFCAEDGLYLCRYVIQDEARGIRIDFFDSVCG